MRTSPSPFASALGVIAALIVVSAATATPSEAQGVLGRVKQKVSDATQQAADGAADKAAGAAANVVQCAATDTGCIQQAQSDGKRVAVMDASGKRVSGADSAKAIAAATTGSPSPQAEGGSSGSGAAAPTPGRLADEDAVLVNYDFVPGDRVIFAEDFSNDQIGDFPKRLELKQGNLEVVDYKGQRFLRSVSASIVTLPLPETLPDRFTFEADYTGGEGWSMDVDFAPEDLSDAGHAIFSPNDGGIEGPVASTMTVPEKAQRAIGHIAVMADGRYVKAYVNGVRVANVPNINLGRAKSITLTLPGSEDDASYITNIRVAEGGKKLYDALAASGRVTTHGILFATGSDQIRTESKPTLDQIADMLKQHPELRLLIEGHTDNVGSSAANQVLSDKRAAAVKSYLVATYGLGAGRLTTKGLGDTRPAAANTTAEGRQTNRRVELVKQ